MIESIGVDIVDINRFQHIIDRWGDTFLNRILTSREYAYCSNKANSTASMAVRFAAKEAFIKALRDDVQVGFQWHNVEVMNQTNGRPTLNLFGKLSDHLKNRNIHISLSHSDSSAIAMVIIELQGE